MNDPEQVSFARAIHDEGWATIPAVLDPVMVAALRADVAVLAAEGRGGARNLLDHEPIRALAISPSVRILAGSVLGAHCFAVRALLFDKTPSANWKVIWHQDLTIATRERADVPRFGPWTVKAGVPHVQPPAEILERMLAVRIHLDPCGSTNGPVRVLAGSHRAGRLSATAIDNLRTREEPTECTVAEGGVLAFRPLLLHASAPATAPGHRRVIHIEFASVELPLPLDWHRRVG